MTRIAIFAALIFAGLLTASPAAASGPVDTAMKAAGGQSLVQVRFASGDRVSGKVNARSSSIRLWLEIESGATAVVLPVKWSSVVSVKPVNAVTRPVRVKAGKSQSQRAHALLFDPAG